MTTATMDARDLRSRLSRLYQEGRYQDTLREGASLELPAAVEDGTVNVELARAMQALGCAHRELNDLPAAEERLW